MTMRRILLLIPVALVLLAVGGWHYLFYTEAGARRAWDLAESATDGALTASSLSGNFAAGLTIKELRFTNETATVEVASLSARASVDLFPLSVTVSAASAAGIDIETAVVGIAGGHIRSFNSRGVVAVSGRDRTVTHEDIDRVMEAARAVNIPTDREILHVLPQEYVLDDQGSISSPLGMTGSRLEANVHIITAEV